VVSYRGEVLQHGGNVEDSLGARASHAIRRLIKGGIYGPFPNAHRGDRPKYVANYYLGTR
jgi:hypothetical protein